MRTLYDWEIGRIADLQLVLDYVTHTITVPDKPVGKCATKGSLNQCIRRKTKLLTYPWIGPGNLLGKLKFH